jgi:hypothetical protein
MREIKFWTKIKISKTEGIENKKEIIKFKDQNKLFIQTLKVPPVLAPFSLRSHL